MICNHMINVQFLIIIYNLDIYPTLDVVPTDIEENFLTFGKTLSVIFCKVTFLFFRFTSKWRLIEILRGVGEEVNSLKFSFLVSYERVVHWHIQI